MRAPVCASRSPQFDGSNEPRLRAAPAASGCTARLGGAYTIKDGRGRLSAHHNSRADGGAGRASQSAPESPPPRRRRSPRRPSDGTQAPWWGGSALRWIACGAGPRRAAVPNGARSDQQHELLLSAHRASSSGGPASPLCRWLYGRTAWRLRPAVEAGKSGTSKQSWLRG